MKKRRLGKTDLLVSEIGLGCWQLGGLTTINNISLTMNDVNEKTAEEIICTSIEKGINTFDTADFYSLGNSERRLGKSLKDRRSDVCIFTKAGSIPSYSNTNPFEIDLSQNHLMAALNRSLKRLGTDYVDLFQTHVIPYTDDEYNEIEKVFNKIKSEGKARYCGVSISSEYERAIKLIEKGFVDVIQLTFSLLDFKPIKKLLTLAKKNNVGVIASKPLSQGFLTEKYNESTSFTSTDIRSRLFSQNEIKSRINQAKKFQFLVNEKRTMSQVALAYILSFNAVSTCIPGAKSIEQVKSNVLASDLVLTPSELMKIENIQEQVSIK
jgi:aryl-alcohol dehydrogenase-like predicted oxidoreductase